MADFELNIDSLTDSKSITSAIKQSFYPQDQQIVQNTSQSQSGNFDRTLMSRDVNKVLQGDALYRNPAFALAGYEQNTKASMHTILSMGADLDNVSIADPDDPDGEPISGSQARLEIARRSVMSTGFAPGGFEDTMKAFISSTVSDPINESPSGGSNGESTGTVEDSSGNSIPHSTKGYSTSDSAQVYNGGNRSIAVVSQLTQQEKDEYARKVDVLLKKSNLRISQGDSGILQNGFLINFNQNSKQQDLAALNFDIKQSGSYINIGSRMQWQTEIVDKSLFGSGGQRCMISAALVESLNRISDSLFLRGGFGVGRGILGPNFSLLTPTNNSVSDHAFGRGFDIAAVGQTANTATNFDSPVPTPSVYLSGLKLLLQYIEALPQDLHPDLIMVSDQINNDLGIRDGLEANDSPVRKMYPNLSKSVNFGSDSNHRNHIHISFGSKRAGAILPSTSFSSSNNPSSASPSTTPATNATEKLKKAFKQGDAALSDLEVFTLLNVYGNFGEETSAVFTAIARRESRYNPWATNDSGFWGLWQLASRNNAGGLTVVELQVPSKDRIKFWKLAYKNWREAGLTEATSDNFIRNIQKNDPTNNAGRQFFDERAFIPINQVYALRAKFGARSITKRFDKLSNGSASLLVPWGDSFLYHGWLSGVRFSDAKDAYIKATGKTEDQLRRWILENVPANSRSRNPDPTTNKTTLESWLDGKQYGVIYKSQDGTWAAPSGWPSNPTPK
jgi:hypothetical protein